MRLRWTVVLLRWVVKGPASSPGSVEPPVESLEEAGSALLPPLTSNSCGSFSLCLIKLLLAPLDSVLQPRRRERGANSSAILTDYSLPLRSRDESSVRVETCWRGQRDGRRGEWYS